MKISWYGNSCFLIEGPYTKKIVLSPNNLYWSNYNFNTSCIFLLDSTNIDFKLPNEFLNRSKLINSVCEYTDDTLRIFAFHSFRDDLCGLKRGDNIIYKILLNNLSIVHLGTIGDIPSADVINNIKNPDILFVPVGGNLCIDGKTASKLIALISPKYIIPMNYKTSSDSFYFEGLHDFIIKQKTIVKINSSTLHVNKLHDFKDGSTIVLDSL